MDRAESILSEAEVFAAQGWKGKMAWEPLIRVRDVFILLKPESGARRNKALCQSCNTFRDLQVRWNELKLIVAQMRLSSS